ncbi:MAG: DUF3618 domain-containing protein [Haliea sp.]
MNKATDSPNDNVHHDDDHHVDSKSPEQLEREVDQARSRLGRTASELSDRLSPGELIDQALGMAREHGGEFGRNLGAQVKSNPLPMILTSIGISWMMMSSGNSSATKAYGSPGTSTERNGRGFKDTLEDTAHKTRDKAAAVGDRVQGATANARESAQDARETLSQFYREQPLIAGSLGIAIGAALGALVPPTEIEDDMLGAARDRSVDAVKSKAASTYDEARESAKSL